MSLDRSVDPVSIGLPATIPIPDEKRYRDCDARIAHFEGIEDKKAVYLGECKHRHQYMERVQLTEKQVELLKTTSIVNGQIQYGVDIGYDAEPLGDF